MLHIPVLPKTPPEPAHDAPEHTPELEPTETPAPEQKELPPESGAPPAEETETVPSAADVALKELISECKGAACEVQSEDNYLFFAGHVAQQDPDFKVVTIEPRRGSEAPLGVEHGTPVKVQIRARTEWGNLVMVYGTVSVCGGESWNIFVQNAVACNECRRAFRQRVTVDAQLLWGPGFHFRGKCRLDDISLVGAAFYSPLKLDVGRQLILNIPALLPGGPSYRFACTVAVCRNMAKPAQSPSWRYGCSFEPLDEDVETQLYKDIMALQSKGMLI